MPPHIEQHDRFLRVSFGDGHHADYHWIWLRHECSLDRHPQTGERTLCASRVAPTVRPVWTELAGDLVRIRWRDERIQREPSTYSLAWLRENAYAPDREDVPAPSGDVAQLETTLLTTGLLPPDWGARLARDGALIARARGQASGPEHTERLIDQLSAGPNIGSPSAEGLSVIGTHFGRIEDLRTDNTTNQNTDQLGYTDAGIDLHTDQPFLDTPPRYQLLHCVRPAIEGGQNLVVDADRLARHLAATDAEALRILERTDVRFHRKQRAFERLFVGPILTRTDARWRVRHSPFTMAPQRLAFAEMEGWYRAYSRFAQLASDRAHRFMLCAGDVLLYDNHRMLHGRTTFRGERWVRGVYFDERRVAP